jgi:hypothetical protein
MLTTEQDAAVTEAESRLPGAEDRELLRAALKQLLDEVIAAGFDSATDYNWPKAIKDARYALGEQRKESAA